MSTIAELVAKLILDTTGFKNGMKDAEKSASTFGTNLMKSGTSAIKTGTLFTAAAVPVTMFYKSSIDGAADFGEQVAKNEQVFKGSFGTIDEWSKTTSNAFGISSLQALEYAGDFGNIMTAQGLTTDASAELSTGLVELAADQAAFNNIANEDVLDKFKSGLIGMYRPMLDLGIVMNAEMVEAKAFEMGLADVNGELSTSALVQARYAIMAEQSSNAIGQFGRETEGMGAQSKIMQANLTDLKVTIGEQLLPVVLKIMEGISNLISWFTNLSPAAQKIITVIGGLIVVIGPLIVIIGTLMTAVGAISTFLAGPLAAAIGGTVVAFAPVLAIIAAVIAIVVLLKRAWDTNFGGIQEKTAVVVNYMKENLLPIFNNVADFVGGALTKAFNGIANAIQWVIDKVKDVIGWFGKIDVSLPDWLVPGSPTPFETGLRGIGSAFDSLKNKDFMVNASANVDQPTGLMEQLSSNGNIMKFFGDVTFVVGEGGMMGTDFASQAAPQ